MKMMSFMSTATACCHEALLSSTVPPFISRFGVHFRQTAQCASEGGSCPNGECGGAWPLMMTAPGGASGNWPQLPPLP